MDLSHESDSDQPPPLTGPSNSEISEDSDVEQVYLFHQHVSGHIQTGEKGLSKPPHFPRQDSKSEKREPTGKEPPENHATGNRNRCRTSCSTKES